MMPAEEETMLPPMSAFRLILAKVVAVTVLTLASALGVCTPFWYFRCRRKQAPVAAASAGHSGGSGVAGNRHKMALAIANNFSAGMLLGMGLLHFLPEALEGVASPRALTVWFLIGVLIPALVESSSTGGNDVEEGTGSSHSHAHSHLGRSTTQGKSFLTMLAVLMCVHGSTEGVMLGFEASIHALRVSAIPLTIHKYFDGLVIGIAMTKEIQRQLAIQDSEMRSRWLPPQPGGSRSGSGADVDDGGGSTTAVGAYGATADPSASSTAKRKPSCTVTVGREGPGLSDATSLADAVAVSCGARHSTLPSSSTGNHGLHSTSVVRSRSGSGRCCCCCRSGNGDGDPASQRLLDSGSGGNINAAFEHSMETTSVIKVLRWPSVCIWLLITPVVMAVCIIFTAQGTTATTGSPTSHPNTEPMWLNVVQSAGSGSFVYIALVDIVAQETVAGLRGGIALVVGAAFVELLIHIR